MSAPSASPAPLPRVLVVEDEHDIAALIALHLQELPAEVVRTDEGRRALALASEGGFDAMVLDLRLPGLDGLDVCRELRRRGSALPILMLTARHREHERVLGLELGADDYLGKPFGVLELRARVKALLRRAARTQAPPVDELPAVMDAGSLRIDRVQRRAWRDAVEISLSPREFDLLWHFARQPGRVFTRAELLADVWGHGHEGFDHTVNSHINRLRDKLGQGRDEPGWIRTVWGVGYRFEATP
jgi:DNA-binding response OmpR family regulator